MTEFRHARRSSAPQAWDTPRRSRKATFLPSSPESNTTTTTTSPKSPEKPLRSILKKPKQSSPPPPKTQLITYPEHDEHRNHRSRSKSQPPPVERAHFTSDALTRRPSRPPAPEPPRHSRSPSPVPSISSTVRPQLSEAGSSEVDFHVGPYNPKPTPPRESRKTKHRPVSKPLYTYGHGYPAAEKCTCGHYSNTPVYYYTAVQNPTPDERRPRSHRSRHDGPSYRRPNESLAYVYGPRA